MSLWGTDDERRRWQTSEDRATQPMDTGGWVSQIHFDDFWKDINDLQVRSQLFPFVPIVQDQIHYPPNKMIFIIAHWVFVSIRSTSKPRWQRNIVEYYASPPFSQQNSQDRDLNPITLLICENTDQRACLSAPGTRRVPSPIKAINTKRLERPCIGGRIFERKIKRVEMFLFHHIEAIFSCHFFNICAKLIVKFGIQW